MNRLSPLVRPSSERRAAIMGMTMPEAEEAGSERLNDLRQFALGWLGGLVFFGTFLA